MDHYVRVYKLNLFSSTDMEMDTNNEQVLGDTVGHVLDSCMCEWATIVNEK